MTPTRDTVAGDYDLSSPSTTLLQIAPRAFQPVAAHTLMSVRGPIKMSGRPEVLQGEAGRPLVASRRPASEALRARSDQEHTHQDVCRRGRQFRRLTSANRIGIFPSNTQSSGMKHGRSGADFGSSSIALVSTTIVLLRGNTTSRRSRLWKAVLLKAAPTLAF